MKPIVLFIALITFVAILSGVPFAQPTPATPPAVPVEFKAEFFKAQSQMQQTEASLEQTPQWKVAQEKQQAFQAVIVKFQKLCGSDFQPQLDTNGDPVCVVKPAPPPAPQSPKTEKK
jgi:hypothetical protein